MNEPKDDFTELCKLLEKRKMPLVRYYVPEHRDGEWTFTRDPIDLMFEEAMEAVPKTPNLTPDGGAGRSREQS